MTKVLSAIDSLREGWYFSPVIYHGKTKAEFKYRSYAHSGLEELNLYIVEHVDVDPITAIEDFRHIVDNFACETKSYELNFMFSIYYDVATDVLDVLLGL